MRGDTVMNLPTPGYGNVEVNNSGASNSGNTSGGLKKPLIIIAAILGVVIIGATAPCALGATGINPIACRRDHF